MRTGELKGKVAFITGAAGAIGSAISYAFIRESAKVVIVDIDKERLFSLKKEMDGAYKNNAVMPVVADVRNSAAIRKAFKMTMERFKRLDILVNNAAATQIKPVDRVQDKDIDLVVDTNLKGYIKCAREAVKIMKGRDIKGVLLFVSSKNGIEGASEKCLYSAAKGGELVLARALAKELGPFGIRVNSICPDAVIEGSSLWEDESYRLGTCKRYGISEAEIPQHYKNRCALKTNIGPEDVANAALFLVSEKASKITGAILTVDGGVAFVR